MIVHCKTVEQLEDVIKTEGLILSKTDINTLAWYVGTEKFEVCIDTKNSTWYNSRNAKSTITPYADWKLHKLIDESERIELSILEGAHASTILNRLERQREIAKEMVEISKQLRYQDGKEGVFKFRGENEMKFEDGILKCECIFDYGNMVKTLQSLGYTITPPYIPPTDEEIVARILTENKKINYVPDWSSTNEKYQITFDTDRNTYRLESRIYTKNVGVVYTTKEIATQIVVEMNEKKFERVSE